jgi:hypothetical protein
MSWSRQGQLDEVDVEVEGVGKVGQRGQVDEMKQHRSPMATFKKA